MIRLIPVLVLFLAACGGDDREVPPEIRETHSTLGGVAISDTGATFELAPGAHTSLRLSSDYRWSKPVVEGRAVKLSRVDYFQDPGFSEWIVWGVRLGTSTISSLGTPACAGQDGCPDEPSRFQVEITVAG